MKKTALLLLGCIMLVLACVSVPAFAEAQDLSLGESYLSASPPDYEKAAECFRRAGSRGDAEGYYRLAEMYEKGLLVVGNPCTDDLAGLGLEKAAAYYAKAAQAGYAPAKEKRKDSFRSITPAEAQTVMESGADYWIVDVRTEEEYAGGHIPGAICIPVETITQAPPELPDYDRTILVYCRSGRRSVQAAQKLASCGYTDVREFGGIIDWPGETVTEEPQSGGIWTSTQTPLSLRYERMWIYSAYAVTEDAELIAAIVNAVKALEPGEASGRLVTDYTDILTFRFADGSQLRLEFEENNWVKNDHERYHVDGLGTLRGLLDALLEETGGA